MSLPCAGAEEPPVAAADGALRRRAWTTVVMAMTGTMCCSTSVVLTNVGVFTKPLADDLGWSRGAIAGSLSIAAISMALANPFVGKLIDRYGVRPVLLTSLAGFGLATAATPALIGIAGIWGMYLGYLLVACIGAGSNVIAYARILSGWFSGTLDKSRGLALGISSAGIPLGAAVSGPLAVFLIEKMGWQNAYVGLAMLPLLVGIPIAYFAIRTAPHDEARMRRTYAPASTAWKRSRPFWILLAMVFLMSSCLQGVWISVPPLLSDMEMSPENIALVLAAGGASGIVARISAGFLFDRFFAPHVALIIFATAAASAFSLSLLPSLPIAVGAILLVQVGSGTESDFIGFTVGRYFGLRAYGQIFGYVYGAFMIGIALGPLLFSMAFDRFGDYRVPCLIAGIGLVVLCVLLAMMPKYPPQADHID